MEKNIEREKRIRPRREEGSRSFSETEGQEKDKASIMATESERIQKLEAEG